MQRLISFFVLLLCAVIFSPCEAFSVNSGEAAPAFELSDLHGRRHGLSDYLGKVVLINFWASWCRECVTEMPSLNTLYSQLSGQGLAVLGVTVDRKAEDAGSAAEKARIAYPVLLDSKGEVFIKKYAVIGLPATVIVDRKGIVRETLIGTQDFLEKELKARIISFVKE
ncbi:MAG: TlpA family protein disulfide reductase [Nitrospirae bacterium]|nr:TlpA family protein disulfide reductase [Nitrospirota bacterium]